MRFSERIGKKKPLTEIRKEGLSKELVNSLWTIYLEFTLASKSVEKVYQDYTEKSRFFRSLWIHFFKRPIDNLGMNYGEVSYYDANTVVRKWYYEAEWYEKLDFIEFCINYDDNKYSEAYNGFLKKELSAYRYIDGQISEINSKEEIVEIENAITQNDTYRSVKAHLKTALRHFSDLKNPDFRNSVKESISAVESMCKIILNDDKTTLGQALKLIEKEHQIPKALQAAFSSLYGYTSNEGGIRHALLEENIKIDSEEARFMLVTCSAFINYLKSKI